MVGKYIEIQIVKQETTEKSANEYMKFPVTHHQYYLVLDKIRVSKKLVTGHGLEKVITMLSIDKYLCRRASNNTITQIDPTKITGVFTHTKVDKITKGS